MTTDLFAPPRPVESLADLFASVWQIGYVCPDLDQGMEFMRESFGLEHCVEVPTDTAVVLDHRGEQVPWETRIAMGARGGLIIELIEPLSGDVEFYRRFLPADGSFGVRLHHIATHVPLGDDVWEDIGELLAASGLRFDHTVLIPDRVRAGYVDTSAALGHLLEVCQLQEADIELFSGIVRDSA
jgi:glyoxalase/bleomycin resistance protein/dioxygenase superfamily protein